MDFNNIIGVGVVYKAAQSLCDIANGDVGAVLLDDCSGVHLSRGGLAAFGNAYGIAADGHAHSDTVLLNDSGGSALLPCNGRAQCFGNKAHGNECTVVAVDERLCVGKFYQTCVDPHIGRCASRARADGGCKYRRKNSCDNQNKGKCSFHFLNPPLSIKRGNSRSLMSE